MKDPNADSFQVLTKINFIGVSTGHLKRPGSGQLAERGARGTMQLLTSEARLSLQRSRGAPSGREGSRAPRPGPCHRPGQSRKPRGGGLALRRGRGETQNCQEPSPRSWAKQLCVLGSGGGGAPAGRHLASLDPPWGPPSSRGST